MDYNIIVYLDNDTEVTLPVQYENEYQLRKDVTAIGTNGVWQDYGKEYSFIPSHRIRKIDVIEDKAKL